MNTHADKTQRTKSQTPAHSGAPPQRLTALTEHIADSRPEALAQGELQAMANASPQVLQLKAYQELADTRHAMPEPVQKKANNTGLTDNLKTGIEHLSGFSMDHVRVHYNSDKPAQLQAHAYAQGTEIHVAPGQERHLSHEAWHVVQQMQGRVMPTRQMKGGVQVNDDARLEKEADTMGEKAIQFASFLSKPFLKKPHRTVDNSLPVSQRTIINSTKVLQLNGGKEKWLQDAESENGGMKTEGDFIWYDGQHNQGLRMSHVHLFEVSDTIISGQLTIRFRESDNGGLIFNSASISKPDIISYIIRLRGNDEAGRVDRNDTADGLSELIDTLIGYWNRTKGEL